MKNLIIYGAGDLGEEFIWYIDEINSIHSEWNVLGFVDDGLDAGTTVSDYPVLGGMEYLLNYKEEIYVICSIALPNVKKRIIEQLKSNRNIKYPVIIHPTAVIAKNCEIGEGVCIGPNAVVSVKTHIGNQVVIEQFSSIGHHSSVGDYTLIAPGCFIGGHVNIGDRVDMGIGCSVKLLAKIQSNVILGAGAVVIKDLPANSTAVGVPAKPIKFREG